MKQYTDLFIDFDDTIYDTHGNAILSLKELYEAFNWKDMLLSEEQFYQDYWATNTELWEQYNRAEIVREYLIIERFRRPLYQNARPEYKDDITPDYCLRVSDKFLDLCSVKPGVVSGAYELLEYLRQKGYRMHLCSNGFHEVQYRKLRSSKLDGYFEHVILSEDAGANKPSQAFFNYAFKETGARAETTLMIGDSYSSDISGALDAGIDTLYFQRKQQQPPLPREPKYRVFSLKEIQQIL